ncbi:MAG: CAP domain-containing protein [Chloroflexota bacterium]
MSARWQRRLLTPGRLTGLAYLAVLFLSLLGTPGSAKDLAAAGRLDRTAASGIVTLTNAARTGRSLDELAVNSRLTLAAERYAEAMAGQDWFDHVGPDGSTLAVRAEAAGYLGWAYLGENLARGAGPVSPASVVAGWMSSPGHRDNLLSPVLRETGVGCFVRSRAALRFWCVQYYGTRGY